MAALAMSYNEWVPISLIRHTVRHVIAALITICAFSLLYYVTKKVVPVPFVRDSLDAIETFVVLFLAGLLAMELLRSYIRETCGTWFRGGGSCEI